ncbi:MAG: TIGR02206 family membrane protein [Pseudorhodoplanes sp.]|nr:TIGR02206 family membrane protein [Pseudorhodoplanes sp.]
MSDPVSNVTSAGAWDIFAPYTALHLATVCVCALAIAVLVAVGRRERRDPARTLALRRGLGIFGIAYWLTYNIWWNRDGIDLAHGLPLHLCDLNGLVAPLALLTQNRWLRATLYFWAVTLTLQAFVQPSLTLGPAHAVFWWFWAAHTLIVGYAVYDLAVLGFRPDWRDLGRVYAVSAIYLAAVVPVNLLLQSNYGFIGNPPPDVAIPPFVAALGPWPQRAVAVVALAAFGFMLAVLPWQRRTARAAA